MASSPAVTAHHFPFSPGDGKSAVLQHLAETPRLARVTAASHLEIRPAPDTVSTGIPSLDTLTGGLPRGGLTEIIGPDSSGGTSVLLAALAAATQRGEICALIDAADAFHPHSGAAAGIDLTRLLWVRCTPTPPARAHGGRVSARGKDSCAQSHSAARSSNSKSVHPEPNSHLNFFDEWKRRQMEDPVEQALRATDLLLQSGGFGMVAIDLAGIPIKTARRVPLTTWFRFRRVIEATPTVMLLVGEQPCAQTCATLGLRMTGQDSSESLQRRQKLAPSASAGSQRATAHESPAGDGTLSTHVHLFEGLPITAELLRARTERKPAQSVTRFPTKAAWTG